MHTSRKPRLLPSDLSVEDVVDLWVLREAAIDGVRFRRPDDPEVYGELETLPADELLEWAADDYHVMHLIISRTIRGRGKPNIRAALHQVPKQVFSAYASEFLQILNSTNAPEALVQSTRSRAGAYLNDWRLAMPRWRRNLSTRFYLALASIEHGVDRDDNVGALIARGLDAVGHDIRKPPAGWPRDLLAAYGLAARNRWLPISEDAERLLAMPDDVFDEVVLADAIDGQHEPGLRDVAVLYRWRTTLLDATRHAPIRFETSTERREWASDRARIMVRLGESYEAIKRGRPVVEEACAYGLTPPEFFAYTRAVSDALLAAKAAGAEAPYVDDETLADLWTEVSGESLSAA